MVHNTLVVEIDFCTNVNATLSFRHKIEAIGGAQWRVDAVRTCFRDNSGVPIREYFNPKLRDPIARKVAVWLRRLRASNYFLVEACHVHEVFLDIQVLGIWVVPGTLAVNSSAPGYCIKVAQFLRLLKLFCMRSSAYQSLNELLQQHVHVYIAK